MLTATADPTRESTATPETTTGRRSLLRPVPAGSFVAFRVAFGLLVAFGQLRFLARGWVEEFYLAPERHLTYPGFGWVRPLPASAMYVVVVGLAVLGLLIAAGIRPRLAAGLFTLGFVYCELIDAALYLNHYWFITLAGLLLAILPGPQDGVVPAINVWALRGQLAVVYVFAGFAKLNSDWLFRAEPLDTWLAARTDRTLIGPWLDEAFVAYAFSWAGAAFDLTIVAWLLWRRTRLVAYLVLVTFHVMTAMLFQIGIFPWVMIALTPIFFAPDWPTRLRQRLRPNRAPADQHTPIASSAAFPRRVRSVTIVVLIVLAVLNLALPLRHYLAPGNVRWNDDGYLLSWRVMLTERATHLTFEVVDPVTGQTWTVAARDVLTEWQASAAEVRTDLVLDTAHLIAAEFEADAHPDVEVYADAFVAWNGRLRQRWIDPDIDLAAVSEWDRSSTFVLPANPPRLD